MVVCSILVLRSFVVYLILVHFASFGLSPLFPPRGGYGGNLRYLQFLQIIRLSPRLAPSAGKFGRNKMDAAPATEVPRSRVRRHEREQGV